MNAPATPTSIPRVPQIAVAVYWARFHLFRNLRRRSFLLWVLALAVALIALRVTGAPARIVSRLALVYVTPLLALFFGSGVMREEIEDQTLTYSFTRPVRRALLYAARVVAAAGPVVLLAVPAAALSAGGFGEALRYGGAALVAAITYTCLFALIGLRSKGSAWIGVGFFLVWEIGVGFVPGFLGRLTLMTHLRSLAGVDLGGGVLGALWHPVAWPISLAVLVTVGVLCLALGGLWTGSKEYPLSR